jgi:leucyl aminopeptidase (aminopeptidase T)
LPTNTTLDENALGVVAETARKVVEDCLDVRAGEKFLVITDEHTSPSIPRALVEVADRRGAETVVTKAGPIRSGEEPPFAVVAAMLEADVVLACASSSMYHTEAKGAAQAKGVRGLFNSPCDEEIWSAGAMTTDYAALRAVAERLRDRMAVAKEVRVTSPAGTDVTMRIEGRAPKGWLTGICRNAGEVSALPGGEVSLPPLEGTTEGVVVVERVMTDLGALDNPITWRIEKGEVAGIEGGEEASRLERYVDGVENARNIGELGIGINPDARLTDNIIESKKKLGTVHIAMGDSAGGYGGLVVSDLHLDGMVLDARIEFDGEVIMENGTLSV